MIPMVLVALLNANTRPGASESMIDLSTITADRWQRIEAVLAAARELLAHRDTVCANRGDPRWWGLTSERDWAFVRAMDALDEEPTDGAR